MQRSRPLLIALVLLTSAALASPLLASDERKADSREVIEVIRLQNLETQSAVIVCRAIFQTRQIVELADRKLVILRDTAENVERARALLKEIDIPPLHARAGGALEDPDTVVATGGLPAVTTD